MSMADAVSTGLAWWIYVIVGLGVVLVCLGILVLVLCSRSRNRSRRSQSKSTALHTALESKSDSSYFGAVVPSATPVMIPVWCLHRLRTVSFA
jgi:hypothetical protein